MIGLSRCTGWDAFFSFFLNDSNVSFFQIVVRSAMITGCFRCLHEQIRGTVKAEKSGDEVLDERLRWFAC